MSWPLYQPQAAGPQPLVLRQAGVGPLKGGGHHRTAGDHHRGIAALAPQALHGPQQVDDPLVVGENPHEGDDRPVDAMLGPKTGAIAALRLFQINAHSQPDDPLLRHAQAGQDLSLDAGLDDHPVGVAQGGQLMGHGVKALHLRSASVEERGRHKRQPVAPGVAPAGDQRPFEGDVDAVDQIKAGLDLLQGLFQSSARPA